MRKLYIYLFALLLVIPFISASESWKYNYLDPTEDINGGNYSINSNYSTYSGDAHLFDGYSSIGLYTFYKSLFDSIYAPISSLANYLPLTGGTMSGNIISTANITADYFIGDGSQLTGIQSEDLSNIFYEYYTSSKMKVVYENLSESDVTIINEIVQPGEHYVYGGYLE
jgi:hypothetical protein